MKKNGRKYRKTQREKEIKKNRIGNLRTHICQEVNGINTAYFSMARIVTHNPIIMGLMETKREYLRRLKSYINAGGWNCGKLECAELAAYEKIILDSSKIENSYDISFYKYYILFDLVHILAYEFEILDVEKVKEQYKADFENSANPMIVDRIFELNSNSRRKVKRLLREPELAIEKEYIQLMEKNILFKRKEPTGIMVTANMSAGKSTFINALTGKYVCLSQNMACTSKVHYIINKAFEDGFFTEYDHDLVFTASKEELLNDNELNLSDEIVVSTRFIGGLAHQRMIINDSPGVNYSGDEEHKKIAEKLMQDKNYNLLIYIMNATQLATNDESDHLNYVKKHIGKIPVLFVINKVDAFNIEEENIEATVQRQTKMLKQKGFKDPIVCPVSARAGYLAKKYQSDGLSNSEKRELYNYIDKFDEMGLNNYYNKTFKRIVIEDEKCEEKQLLKTSGLAYIEKIIIAMCKGGNTNGSNIY